MSRKNPTRQPKSERDASDLREVFELWREDTTRAAERIDVTGELADRVVAAAVSGHPPAIVPAGARWYAAAAVLLIAVGIAGTFMARSTQAAGAPALRYVDIEEAHINALADAPELAPGLEAENPKRGR